MDFSQAKRNITHSKQNSEFQIGSDIGNQVLTTANM